MLVFDLDGQKVLSADRRVDETVLEFDLGTTLRMGKSMFPGDMESALWSISLWEGYARVFRWRRSDVLESGQVGTTMLAPSTRFAMVSASGSNADLASQAVRRQIYGLTAW
jgi:hypothetical protein